MADSFKFIQGNLPILVSMPHNGTEIPDEIAANIETSALKVVDTDWYQEQLYQFAREMGCSLIIPYYSRYVIDLNRPENDENLYPGSDTTGLCPINQFDFKPIYKTDYQLSQVEIERRVNLYWRPYHSTLKEELQKIRQKFGFALLFEAHSIKSVVPRFFEGQLPDFNFGNNNGASCSKSLEAMLEEWQPEGYSKVINGRFKGGYITRAYGKAETDVESLQLELSQFTYMDESTLEIDEEKMLSVVPQLRSLFELLTKYCETRIQSE
ncbi:MAG: N-formylglutamate deformylase [Kangiellaceae bacterium]|nr:N-formylglutamate deformylase [Kangiellaceae bacterium]MCW8999398.1 N-formylglutamate deformylase [Kangiellaceae bacterium]MCW9018550.1 N-formylglutamate deformylase [Kangiellaceae bacterium]